MSQGTDVEHFAIPGMLLLRPPIHRDLRGDLTEVYQESAFRQNGITDTFVQDNLSTSTRGVLRGLHFQLPPFAQAKLVRVLSGEVYDVVLDLRHESPAFSRWQANTLTESSGTLYIPRGCAHGVCVVSETATVLYKLSAEYAPASECGLAWDDPELGITWPVRQPIVSARDMALPSLDEVSRRLAQVAPAW